MRNTIEKGSKGRGFKGSRERHLNPGTPGQDPLAQTCVVPWQAWSRPTLQQGGLRFSGAGLESSNPEIYENYWHTGDEYKFAE